MTGRVAEEMTEEGKEVRSARRAANLTVTGTKEALETKVRARVKPDIAPIAESKDRRGTVSLKEKTSLEAPDDEGDRCWPRRNRITRWEKRMDPRQAFHYFAEDDEDE